MSQPVHAPREPFGQTGVRQYVGSFAALLSAVLVAACLTLWFRSDGVMDTLELYEEGSRTIFQSAGGCFVLARIDAVPGEGAPGWAFSSRQTTRSRLDRWPASIWKKIGIEYRNDLVLGRPGWWLRCKWPLAAAAFSIVPAVHVIGQMKRGRRSKTVAAKPVDTFCRRCGRPIDPTAPRCSCCGRDFLRRSIVAAP